MNEPRPPDRLRRIVGADLRPVRPLPPPWRRSLALVPVSLLLVLFVVGFFGPRSDLQTLGAAGWGLSSLEVVAGVLLVALALADAIPGRLVPTRVLAAAFALSAALVVGVTAATMAISPTTMPPRLARAFWTYCFRREAMVALPAVLVAAALAARALPLRPVLVGALYGAGAGLFSDAGWRLFCNVSEPAHVLLAHGGALFALTIVGAFTSHVASRLRSRPPGS